jgi:hypothetical protein
VGEWVGEFWAAGPGALGGVGAVTGCGAVDLGGGMGAIAGARRGLFERARRVRSGRFTRVRREVVRLPDRLCLRACFFPLACRAAG